MNRINRHNKKTLIRITPLLFILFMAWGCTQSPEEQLKNMNGYWEIEKVEFPDGYDKEYKVNTTIDYIEITADSSGFRKKLQPRFDGGFNASDDQENFTITVEDGSISLHYHTSLSQWEERVIKATKERLILRNADNLNYFYKCFEPMDLGELHQ
ncbi:lipocalin family protein [Sinomicrobium sp. M5D2P9]